MGGDGLADQKSPVHGGEFVVKVGGVAGADTHALRSLRSIWLSWSRSCGMSICSAFGALPSMATGRKWRGLADVRARTRTIISRSVQVWPERKREARRLSDMHQSLYLHATYSRAAYP